MTADNREESEPAETRRAKVRRSRSGAFGLTDSEYATVTVPADTAAMWDERYWRARP
jgi:hypothetical protein